MNWPTDLCVVDIGSQLPRANWSIGARTATTSLTWHYNGPAVPIECQRGPGLIAQLRADAEWQMRSGWGGTVNGADGLMYHLAVGSDGTIYQTRDLAALLWHCAHQDGNSSGLALHFPLGSGQRPTPVQLASAIRVCDVLRAHYQIALTRVVGHLEWKHATACPGPTLMQTLTAYRTGLPASIAATALTAGLRRWRIDENLKAPALVRQKPARSEADGQMVPIAGRLKPGTVITVDVVKEGQAVDGNTQWMHMARVPHEQADLGFVSATLGTWDG